MQWLWLGINQHDRRTLAVGAATVLTLVLVSRGFPAWRRWDREQRTAGAESTRALALASSSVRRLSSIHDSATARRVRFDSVSASLLEAASTYEAGAVLASLISDIADASGIRTLGISVRQDSSRGTLARVAVRVAAIGDVEGLVDFLSEIEHGEMLLAIRELSVDQPDVAAPDNRPETLRIDLLIEGLAALTPLEPAQLRDPSARTSAAPPRPIASPAITPSRSARNATLDSLQADAEATIANDPFRLANTPAVIRFVASQTEASATHSIVTPHPSLVLRAIVGGPPWQAVLDGLPGQPPGTVVTLGGIFETIRIRAITRDTVIVQAPDTTWKLTVRRDAP